jgi:hypothetical protein
MPGKLLIFLSILFAGVVSAAPPKTVVVPVEIVSAEFGLFDATNPNEPVFTPSQIVPHRENQRYGWVIEVQTRKRSLAVREEYLLPNTSKVQKDLDALGESLNITTPKRNQVSQRQLVPVDGRIYGEWAIGSNEPAGHRQLQVIIENEVAASFEFDVSDVK